MMEGSGVCGIKRAWTFAYRNGKWSPCTSNPPVSSRVPWSSQLALPPPLHAPTFAAHVRTPTAPSPSRAASAPAYAPRKLSPTPPAGFAPLPATSAPPRRRTSASPPADARWSTAAGPATGRRRSLWWRRRTPPTAGGGERNRSVTVGEGRVLC